VLSALLDPQSNAMCSPWASEKVLYVLIASSGGQVPANQAQSGGRLQAMFRACSYLGALDHSCMFGVKHDYREVTRPPRLYGSDDEESEESSFSKAAEAVRRVILHGTRDADSIGAMFNRPDG